MARYKNALAATALIDEDIIDRLRGEDAEDTRPRHTPLVAGWTLDLETGRPVCQWTLENAGRF